jgi:hypothetical protein
MTIDDVAAARRAITALSPSRTLRRYPPELRAALTRLVRSHPEQSMAELAERLDMPPQTLARFVAAAAPVDLVPVRVVADERPTPPFVVRGPGGLVVEGLDIRGVAALFRALS